MIVVAMAVGSEHEDSERSDGRCCGHPDGDVEAKGFRKFGILRLSLCHFSPRCQHCFSWTRWVVRRLVMLSLCL